MNILKTVFIILSYISLTMASPGSSYSRNDEPRDFHILPAMPVGFGVNAYDGRGGFHFNGRIGTYISFGSYDSNEHLIFALLPTIGYVGYRFEHG